MLAACQCVGGFCRHQITEFSSQWGGSCGEVGMIFFEVAGGPYGAEPVVRKGQAPNSKFKS